MTTHASTPLLIEPDQLETLLGNPDIIIVDLCKPETYKQLHLPGAIHLDYSEIVHSEDPIGGLLPPIDVINTLVQKLGITADTHVISYDEEGGGNASRLIWTLHACGHMKTSLLNGGIFSWAKEGHPVSTEIPSIKHSDYTMSILGDNVIEADEIKNRLDSDNFSLLDARSPGEFTGETIYSNRGGHIPGARLFEWTDAMDKERNMRLKSDSVLLQMLEERDFNKEQEIVVYCQTHHRSALSYFMLKHLGFDKVRGYHGAWSEWGNRTDTPVETGTG